jgi:hypothetical protein
MTRSKRTALAVLEGVEGGLALCFEVGQAGGMATKDESTGDEADEESEEVGDHGVIRK